MTPGAHPLLRPTRRTLWLGFVLLAVLACLAAAYSLALSETLRDKAAQETMEANLAQAETAARFLADQQHATLRLLKVVASRLARRPAALSQGRAKSLEPLLHPLLAAGRQVEAVFVADAAGRVVLTVPASFRASAGALSLAGLPHRPWVSDLMRGQAEDSQAWLTMSSPVAHPAQGALGYLGVVQRPGYWRDFFGQLAARPGRTFFLFDAKGQLVAAGLARADQPVDVLTRLAQAARGELEPYQASLARLTRLPGGQGRAFVAAVREPDFGWVVVAAQSHQAAMAPTRTLFDNVLLFVVLLFACLGFMMLLMLGRYQAQERRLVNLDGQARHLEALVHQRTTDLAMSTQRYASLVADLPDIVYELDSQGRFTFASSAVKAVLGRRPEELLGQPHRELVLPEDRPMYDQHKSGAERGQPLSILALRHLDAHGGVRWLSIHSRGITDHHGRFLGRRGVARDVTAEVLAERRVHELSGRIIVAQEEERKRIALDLHDEMGQQLAALKIGLQSLAKARPEAGGELARLIGLTQRIVDRTRALAYNLRPAILDNFGLTAALTDLCETFGEDGRLTIEARLEQVDDKRLGPAARTTLFRFVQEALTNAHKHSGGRRAEVRLEVDGGVVRATVRDFGQGFDAAKVMDQGGAGRSLGLLGMRERLNLAGGALHVEAGPGGATLWAEAPLTPNQEA